MKRLMEVLDRYAASITRYEADMDALEADWNRFEERWVESFEDVIWELARDDEDLVAELEHELRLYLRPWENVGLDSWPVTGLALVEQRLQEVHDEFGELQGRRQAASEAPVGPFREMVEALRDWRSSSRSDELASEWASVLSRWRHAASLTTREAAERLDVTSATIVRHEKGDRRASPDQVSKFIERIAHAGPLPPDEDRRRAVRTLLRGFQDERSPRQLLEELEQSGVTAALSAEQRIEQQLHRLTVGQMEFVAALLETPEVIDIVKGWLEGLADDPRIAAVARLARTGFSRPVSEVLAGQLSMEREQG